MRLKRLELFGFKSFADRTVLHFDDSFTGIVGPNGCGKSNVVDAVRWVLGEMRPTSMRGGEMSDVVFKGSVSRPPMALAEVTMVLDNTAVADDASGSHFSIPERGAELSITRRVTTGGEGEYLIDGERVRLKDIKDMLFDTGLGSRGYSVLEQGRIDAVLSQNALDRRSIFEEAAGVSRYRQRKKETESRLRRVEQDMQRLDDVLRELASRVRSLKIQAGKAERFVVARDAWRTDRARSLKHRLHEGRLRLSALATELAEFDRRSEDLRSSRSQGETGVAEREQQQNALATEVDRLAEEVARIAGESRACEERCAHLGTRIESWKQAAAEEAARALEMAAVLEVREAELETLTAESRETESAVESARQQVEDQARDVRMARQAHADARQRTEAQNEALLAALHEKTGGQNTLRHLQELRPALLERTQRAAAKLEESRSALAGMQVEARTAGEATQAAQASFDAARAASEAADLRLEDIEREAATAQEERNAKELEQERLRSRVEALRDREREREGLEAGARAVLEGAESTSEGARPFDPAGLRGLVADHLRTSTRHARALDAALGPTAQALVAAAPELCSQIVGWLDSQQAGLVRLVLPAGVGTPAEAPDLAAFDADQRGLIEGRLADFVETSEEFRPLCELLVGDVFVVRDLDTALALCRAHPRGRYVTPTGDLVDAAGVLGGHREIQQGAVGRRASAAELEAELTGVQAALVEAEARLAKLSDERAAVAEHRGRTRADVERLGAVLSECRGVEQTARARLEDLTERTSLIARESAVVEEEVEQLDRDLERARLKLAADEETFERENASLREVDAERLRLEAQCEELQSAEATLRLDLTRRSAELEGRAARLRDLHRVVEESARELQRARRLAAEHEQNAAEAVAEVERLSTAATELAAERAEIGRKHEELRATERAGREEIEAWRGKVDAVTREIEGLTGVQSEKRLEQQRVQLAREEHAVRAVEDLGQTEAELLDGFEPEPELLEGPAMAELDARVSELKAQLDRLGPVNTDAVDELEETETRFKFLDGERKDLLASKQSLAEALERINEESQRLFLETFEEVRGHFQVLFRQLFGGGKADLQFEVGEGVSQDPLEAGIEIVARPPGREMLPIGLLSGGQRTMTALALLFAVFRSRPSPFCVLDEVDAALDDANIGRFLAMLDTFRGETQFLVVTHNKGTMGASDRLYGITMETKGVSTHVAVEFGDVDKFVPEATGNAKAASKSRSEVQAAKPAAAEPALDAELPVDEQFEIPTPPEPQRSGAVDSAGESEPAAEAESTGDPQHAPAG